MPFDLTKINIGGDYNPTTGVFTCRTPGLYHFAYNLLPYTTGFTVSAQLRHKGVSVGYITIPDFWSGSYSTILDLNMGDEVYILVYAPSYIRGNNSGYSTFNGYLIHEQ